MNNVESVSSDTPDGRATKPCARIRSGADFVSLLRSGQGLLAPKVSGRRPAYAGVNLGTPS